MTIVVEDGTTSGGVPDAESYVTVAFADDYWAKRNNSEWGALTEPQKEAYLRLACQYLDQNWDWIGNRVSGSQYLHWPRVQHMHGRMWLDIEQMIPGIQTIPLVLKQAQCELANEARQGALAASYNPLEQAVISETVGPISTTYSDAKQITKTFPLVDLLLRDIAQGKVLGGLTATAVRA